MRKPYFVIWFLCCVAVAILLTAATPSIFTPWRAFRGSGSLIVATNPAAATVSFAVIGPWTNRVDNILTNTQGRTFHFHADTSGDAATFSNGNPATNNMVLRADGAVEFSGTFRTATPTGGNPSTNRFGAKEESLAITVNVTNAIRVEVNGTKYWLMIANETPP